MPGSLSVPMWGMSYLLVSVLTGAHLKAVLLGVSHLKQSALCERDKYGRDKSFIAAGCHRT